MRHPARGTGHIQIARVLGIPIRLHFSWAVMFGILVWALSTRYFPLRLPDPSPASSWAKGCVAAVLFLASVLGHELGHAVVGLRHGVRTRSITLFILGGAAQLENEPKDGRAELWIAAAGPVVSLALGAAFFLCALSPGLSPSAAAIAQYLALINLMLALFSLVPALPMDGGRLLRGALWGSLGRAQATRIASGAGGFVALFLMCFGAFSLLQHVSFAGVSCVLVGWLIKDAAAASYRQVQLDEALAGVTVRDAMRRGVVTIPAHLSIADAARDYFLRTGYGSFPVMRGDGVVGLLCLSDVLHVPALERESTSVQGAMRRLADEIVTDPDVPLPAALAKLARPETARLLVMHGGELVGLLTMKAVLRRLAMRQRLGGVLRR